jgi:ribosomal protein L11 methyltransferase
MRWLELSIEAPGEYADPLAHIFARHCDGRVAVEEPGGFNPDEGEARPSGAAVVVRGWLPMDATIRSRRAMFDIGIKLISHVQPLPPLREREVSDEEWRNQRFDPVRVGRRLLIAPAGETAATRPGDIVVPLEPGLAFGTGHHPTTRMCLAATERRVRPGHHVLDLGCGSGVLSIAAIKLGASRAVCLDVDEEAVRAAGENLRRAGVGSHARVELGTLPSDLAPAGSFDLTLANISAAIIIKLAHELLRTLKPDGALVASGVLHDRRKDIEQAMERAGGQMASVTQSGEWLAFEVRLAAALPARPT